MEEIKKDIRISEELNRISVLFEEIAENKKSIIAPLLQNAAFMRITLEDLQEQINREGVTEVYQNGANQKGVKQSAAVQSYNSLIKNYASVIKTLTGLLPYKTKIITPWPQPREKTLEEREEEVRLQRERDQKIREEIERAAEKQRLERESQRPFGQ